MKRYLILLVLLCAPAFGSLTTFQIFNGNYGYSSDGLATLTNGGTISASVPVGSTVAAAYLYTATQGLASGTPAESTLNGTPVSYGPFVLNTGVCCTLGMKRADVTSIVKPIIDVGPGGVYNFTVTESNTGFQDGEALVVVYSNPSLSNNTVAILDGFSAAGGDSFTATFANPLHPGDPGFFAEMVLGIGFSCGCGGVDQNSNIRVNGTLITQNAGNHDDDADFPPPALGANGRLFTMGGFDDPFSTLLPTYANDHERYNLVPYIADGSTSILVQTNNPTNDDNIFLAVFSTLGQAEVVGGVPEPSTFALMGLGLAAAAWKARRHRV